MPRWVHFENRPRTGQDKLIWWLCPDPDTLWEFASGTLTILRCQEPAELLLTSQKIRHFVIRLQAPGGGTADCPCLSLLPLQLPVTCSYLLSCLYVISQPVRGVRAGYSGWPTAPHTASIIGIDAQIQLIWLKQWQEASDPLRPVSWLPLSIVLFCNSFNPLSLGIELLLAGWWLLSHLTSLSLFLYA